MGAIIHYEHQMGDNVPEGAHFVKGQAIPGGGAHLFRGGSGMFEWIDRTEDTTLSRKREEY